ncbi:MAG: DUF1275 domain-containing protein [Cyclobacteriaceae bacterium]|nr:DUF1275 domain-containing protein [Cyclobacteriaceae bacterium]
MLRKYSNTRTLSDNIKLGVLTALVAGMVNVASFMLFFSFSSNVTGYFAIFAAEIARADYHQVTIVVGWIFLFFFGSFVSNAIVIHLNSKNMYIAHSLPIILEIVCLTTVGVYGQFFYQETLVETEILLSFMLFAMGLQNGLTASISNFAVKTTHLTGATTDLGILFSMFTKKEFRDNQEILNKAKLILSIACSYVIGAIISGFLYKYVQFKLFFIVSLLLVIIIAYDLYQLKIVRYINLFRRKQEEVKIESLVGD